MILLSISQTAFQKRGFPVVTSLFAHASSSSSRVVSSSNFSSAAFAHHVLRGRQQGSGDAWLIRPMFGRKISSHLRGGGVGTLEGGDDTEDSTSFDFDYLVIGAGSGGIASAR